MYFHEFKYIKKYIAKSYLTIFLTSFKSIKSKINH